MLWIEETVATKIVTLVITPGASQKVVIKQIVGTVVAAATAAGSGSPGVLITATPIVCVGGTYTFRRGTIGNITANQFASSVEWTCADAADPDTWLVGAAGQAITLTLDGTAIAAWTDGENGSLQVFGYLDGRIAGAASTVATV